MASVKTKGKRVAERKSRVQINVEVEPCPCGEQGADGTDNHSRKTAMILATVQHPSYSVFRVCKNHEANYAPRIADNTFIRYK